MNFDSLLSSAAQQITSPAFLDELPKARQLLLEEYLRNAVSRVSDSTAACMPMRDILIKGYTGNNECDLDGDDAIDINDVLLTAAREAVLGFLESLIKDEEGFRKICSAMYDCRPF